MTWLSLSLYLFLGAVLLNLLEPATRHCRGRVRGYEARKKREGGDKLQGCSAKISLKSSSEKIPLKETLAFYLRRVVSREGLLGLVSLPVLLAFLPLNSAVLAEAFAVLLDRPGIPVGDLTVFGINLHLTDLHLYGFSLSLALLLLGAYYAESCQTRSRLRWFLLIGGLSCLWAFEVGVSALRGHGLALTEGRDPTLGAVFSGLGAHVSAVTEATSGIWAVHLFLIPLLQALFWLALAPFRLLGRGWRHLYKAWAASRARKRSRALAGYPGFLVRAGAFLDEGLFDPLRAIDESVGRFVGSLFRSGRKSAAFGIVGVLIGVLIILLQLGCVQLRPAKSPEKICWSLGYDNSGSVRTEEFADYPEIVRHVLLELLSPGDQVLLLTLDGHTAETFVLDKRLTHLKRQTRAIYDRIRTLKQSSGRHGTDVGLVLAHVRRQIALDDNLKGGSASHTAYRVVLVTDGIPDGKQSLGEISGPILAEVDWRILFVGPGAGAEGTLRRLCNENGFEGEERIFVVPFAHWKQAASSLPGFLRTSGSPSPLTAARTVSPFDNQ